MHWRRMYVGSCLKKDWVSVVIMDYMGKKLLGAIFLPSDTVVEDPPPSVDTLSCLATIVLWP
jgi:hypothetical protein